MLALASLTAIMTPLFCQVTKWSVLDDLDNSACADRMPALADREAQTRLNGDGVISCTSIWMLSPGMTISTPLGILIEPVTSVVRK